MKIIQSFWSKPFFEPVADAFAYRARGGFPKKRFFIYTALLSLLQLKEKLGPVHFTTDDAGKALFIDTLGFPFDSYSLDFNALAQVPAAQWAYGKLHVFATQSEPFVHFDNDVILGAHFDPALLQADLVAEFAYVDKPGAYRAICQAVLGEKLAIRPAIRAALSTPGFVYQDYNLGIVGGNDVAFFNAYAAQAKADMNQSVYCASDNEYLRSFLNCFYEQHYFWHAVTTQQKAIRLCIAEPLAADADYQQGAIAQGVEAFSFVHFHNIYKIRCYDTATRWLAARYPAYFAQATRAIEVLQAQELASVRA